MIRRPPRSTPLYSSAASDVYKRQLRSDNNLRWGPRDCSQRSSRSAMLTSVALPHAAEAPKRARSDSTRAEQSTGRLVVQPTRSSREGERYSLQAQTVSLDRDGRNGGQMEQQAAISHTSATIFVSLARRLFCRAAFGGRIARVHSTANTCRSHHRRLIE